MAGGAVMIMNSQGHRAWLCFLFAAAATWLAPEARADETIGVASVVRNDVSGVLVSGTVKVDTGASVVRNEIMKTAEDSSAKLVFTDSTNLAIGPNSTVKLDHFVSSGPSSYGKATIDVAKGVFRFPRDIPTSALMKSTWGRHHRRSRNDFEGGGRHVKRDFMWSKALWMSAPKTAGSANSVLANLQSSPIRPARQFWVSTRASPLSSPGFRSSRNCNRASKASLLRRICARRRCRRRRRSCRRRRCDSGGGRQRTITSQ